MGFLRKLKYVILLIVLSLLVASCGKPLMLKNKVFRNLNPYAFGRFSQRIFFVPKSIDDSLELSWTAETHGSYSNTSFIATDSVLYVGDLSGRITAFNKFTGKELGVIKNKGEIKVAPLVKGKTIVFISNELKESVFTIHFYDLRTGKESVKEFPGSCGNEMLAYKKYLYVLSDQGILYQFNFKGKMNWEVKSKVFTVSSPAGQQNSVWWGNTKGEIIGVDKNGNVIYRRKHSSGFESGVSVRDIFLFLPTVNGTIVKFDLVKKEVVWRFDTKGKIKNFIVFNDKKVFAGNLNGTVYCLNINDGKLVWKTETGGVINATPLLFRNILVQPNLFKKVDLINTENGEIEKTIKFEKRVKSSPLYNTGMIYFGTDYGEIFAYRVLLK